MQKLNITTPKLRLAPAPKANLQNWYARVALKRFGLGPKPNQYLDIRANPIAALQAELDTPEIALVPSTGLPTYAEAAVVSQVGNAFTPSDDVLKKEARVRLLRALQADIGFVERLVWFWSNHFSMWVGKNNTIRAMIGQWEREVIRTNVLGNFADMLVGTMTHPAMITYLDNERSIGPGAAVRTDTVVTRPVGLNQNLAREILELHSLGVDGGYTQADVVSLAKAITGWSLVNDWEARDRVNSGTPAKRGQFIFRSDWHEPGPKTILGKTYPVSGQQQGIDILRDLAVHPSTAQHIAYKLVLHFITDDPSPYFVDQVAQAFLRSKGDLKATAEALLGLSIALGGRLRKIQKPYELMIAQFRAIGLTTYNDTDQWVLDQTLGALGNRPFEWQPPDGYPDETAWWLNPDGMTVRAEAAQSFARTFAAKVPNLPAPADLATKLFGPAVSTASLDRLVASTGVAGYTTLFMIPEFQRR